MAYQSDTGLTDDAEVQKIWEELFQAAIWEFCFDVHRATKLNYLFLDPALDPNVDLEKVKDLEQREEDEKDISAPKGKSKPESYNLPCPNCNRLLAATRIGGHLIVCLGIGGRKSSRDASKKIIADRDEIDDDSNPSSISRRKTKKAQAKRQS